MLKKDYAFRTGQDRTGQDRTGQDRTGQDRTGQGLTLSFLHRIKQNISEMDNRRILMG